MIDKILDNNNNRIVAYLIALSGLIGFAVSYYYMSNGIFIIFQNLFYIPIILSTIYFQRKGLLVSIAIAAIYFLMLISFTNDQSIIIGAVIRVCLFVLIALIVSELSLTNKKKQNEIEEYQSKLSSLMDNLPGIAFNGLTDKNLTMTFMSKDITRLVNFATNDMLNGNFELAKLMPEEFADKLRSLRQGAAHNKRIYETIYPIRDDKNNEFWLYEKGHAGYDANGDFISISGVIVDYTENENARKLRESEKLLNQVLKTKDKFFSIIAHDLRGPLGNFKRMSEYLTYRYDDFSKEEIKDIIFEMRDYAGTTFELLENLLEWSRSQRGNLPFNPTQITLKHLAKNTISLLQPSADVKNIKLLDTIDEEIEVFADANMLTTILRNLLSNAIKFTPEGGTVSIGSSRESDDEIIIFIKDSGIGMEQSTIDKLFKIDQNITTQGTSGEKGTGLGLILCKEFVEKHGGRIWVESQIGEGSIFYFTIKQSNENI